MPPDELVRFADEHDVSVVVLSSTNPATADVAQDTAARLREAGTPVIVGEPGRTLDDLLVAARDLT
jgi:methylmalonyl-CoA mutase cobalamin-binding subunit